ncbi:Methylated-DNA--protein-cysteine methyltransferase [subsurface metagenome]
MTENFFLRRYDSPLGTYILVSSQRGMVCVAAEDRASARLVQWERDGIQMRDDGEHNDNVTDQLDAYFTGKLSQFSVPLDMWGTLFQRQVWELLCGIPYGETRSYGQIARALGRPNSARAVGQAIGRNPVAIIVPCHRVIGSDGDLTGYGGGLHRKQALLELEGAIPPKSSV